MVSRHCHWRTVEEWSELKVPLSTASNEASKMYDATLTQLAANYDDPSVGGVMTTVKNMLKADPDFVVGQCLALELQLFSGKVTSAMDPEFQQSLDRLLTQTEKKKQTHLSTGERKHVQAVKLLADGYMKEACVKWEDILVDHPNDLLALKMAYLGYIYLGDSRQLRDSVARVLPHWTLKTPLYGYVLGMYAFGLEETNLFEQAEKQATKALEINANDAWSTHTLSHVFEMTGQQKRGIAFLDSTADNWEMCGMLACHNWWHMALHHIELGNYEAALEIFEKQVKTRCVEHGEAFNITDAASLLFRLEMEGVETGKQWQAIRGVCEPYLERHCTAFNDIHMMMTCLGAGDTPAVDKLLTSLEKFVREGRGSTSEVHQRTGLQICHALVAYREGNYAQAVSIMYPLRYDVFTVGGSHAQRDVFNLFLIVSALKSSDKHHHCLARSLLAERKALKDSSPMTDRLLAKALTLDAQ
ncbi:hypothetical protein ACOMHN_020507 [Nucella lapillus]